MLLLAGCGKPPETGLIGAVEGFGGAVAADEPRAVLVARDVLSANGTAADAAVALYFALSVTLPSSAGLGGGGICIVHDPKEEGEAPETVALDFLPRAAPAGRVALPGNVRAMAALHARYGRMRWGQLVSAAENLASGGTPASRALARELATAGDLLLADPDVARIFTRSDGKLIEEGDNLRQPELGNVLSQIRLNGAGEFYAGAIARNIAAEAEAMGAPLSVDVLRGVVPEFRDTVKVEFGDHVLHFAPPPAAGGLVAAQFAAMLTEGHDWDSVSEEEKPHLFAEASKRAFAERTRWMQPGGGTTEDTAQLASATHAEQLMASYDASRPTAVDSFDPPPAGIPENPWATSFVVADRDGFAVACNVTMNTLFGAGRMVPGTGVLLAPAPNARGIGFISLGPVILANENTGGFVFAAAASGGPTAATAIISVLLQAAIDEQPLDTAVATKRLHHNGDPDIVFHEENEDPAVLASLTARGHQVQEAGIIGRVEAIWCPNSLQRDSTTCQAFSDRRANGLATILSGE